MLGFIRDTLHCPYMGLLAATESVRSLVVEANRPDCVLRRAVLADQDWADAHAVRTG